MHTGKACRVGVEPWLSLFRETVAKLLVRLVLSDHQCLAWEFKAFLLLVGTLPWPQSVAMQPSICQSSLQGWEGGVTI